MYVAVPTVTARYYPNPKKSLERALFSADINPTPLLELVAQEMAFRAKGKVRVYIEAEKDTYALRNVLKVRRCNLLTVAFSVCLSVCVLLSTLSLSPLLSLSILPAAICTPGHIIVSSDNSTLTFDVFFSGSDGLQQRRVVSLCSFRF